MDPVITSLLTGGGVTTLVGVIVLLLRGDLVTKKASDDRVDAIKTGCAALVAELTTSRDEWKGIAKETLGDVGQLSEALTVRNRIDEALTQKVEQLTRATT